MHFNNVFSTQKSQNSTLDRIIFSQSQIIETELNPIEPTINNPNSSVLMFGFWITALSIICLILVKVLPTLGRANLPLSQVPCQNCKFFAENNQYLKCAVRPDVVLTKQAINCSDYCNRDESGFQADYRFPPQAVRGNQDGSKNHS
ncbi:hypothetical protein IQ255_24565 [Pleurocapsales cyanobacterium LEGE 10410]|nr:hypothetical protein [Pleurocapsales cyanobacterium LEGE 10410]